MPYFKVGKSPKIYFHDAEFAVFLLGIENEQRIRNHPLYGNIFENMAASELLKSRFNRGKSSNLMFLQDMKWHEIEVFMRSGTVETI